MITNQQRSRLISGVLAGLLLLALGTSIYFFSDAKASKALTDRVRLQQDSVLAVKQLLDKEIFQLHIDLDSAKGKNARLDQQIAANEKQLREKSILIDKLLAENATVKTLQHQLKDIRQQRETMNKQLQELLAENGRLSSENTRLQNSVSQLERDKNELQEQLNKVSIAATKAGNFRVEMQRDNTKVTAKHRRTSQVSVSFDLPSNLTATSADLPLYLVVLDPGGKAVKSKTTKTIVLKDGQSITPIVMQSVDRSRNPQTITMNAKPDGKMSSKGIYRIQVYTDSGLIGSAQTRMN